MSGIWTKQQAWDWVNARPWIRGFNGYPQNCVNRIALWQKYNHEEVFRQIEAEFALAKETGFNAVRTIIEFEVWLYEHDSFMSNLEEYFTLADKYGIKVMLVLGNDCRVPKDFYSFQLGEQHVDWGYHSGIKRGQHSNTHSDMGYELIDEPEYREKFFEMVEELAAKYAHDERLQIWNVWNELGNSRRHAMSVPVMEKACEIIRSHDQIQPITVDVWTYTKDCKPVPGVQERAIALSDVISFHNYSSFGTFVRVLKAMQSFGRPVFCTEWLNRITGNLVEQVFPLLYLEHVGSYHWGLIQGYSQTYEPWGCYNAEIADPNYNGPHDLTALQHDLYRFSGLPYKAKEVAIIKEFSSLADEDFKNK